MILRAQELTTNSNLVHAWRCFLNLFLYYGMITIRNHGYPHFIFIKVYLNLLIFPAQKSPSLYRFDVDRDCLGRWYGPYPIWVLRNCEDMRYELWPSRVRSIYLMNPKPYLILMLVICSCSFIKIRGNLSRSPTLQNPLYIMIIEVDVWFS